MTENRVRRYTFEVLRTFLERYIEFKTYVEKGDPSHVEVWVDIHDAVEDAMLTPFEREIISRYYVNGTDSAELGEEYDYSRQGIEIVLKRALAKVTTELTGVEHKSSDITLR